MKVIAERLKNLREKLGVSQAKLAKEIGIAQTSVNRYETDKVTPTVETLLWYADRFDVSLDYIFGRTDNPQGINYKYQPKVIETDEKMEKFVEMCFNPKSPYNAQLKQAILDMIKGDKQ
ncbi:MAG: helix-turn-helix domain-containing protein [Eubacterium sp.]|nr:helix-turn-helix domain-containing protein [Eubacterium sp.]